MKFILIQKQALAPQVVSITSHAFYDLNCGEILETVDNQVLEHIIEAPPEKIIVNIKGKYITDVLLRAITPCYLRGSLITINGVEFKKCNNNPQYFYVWQDRVPAALPQHLKEAYYKYNLRGDLYQELVAWNQSRIDKAIRCSKFKWHLAETFYKDVYKEFNNSLRVISPNAKTFFEATAELNVESWVKPSKALTVEEEAFLNEYTLKQYVKALGLQDTTIQVSSRHRITKHGITDEPIVTCKQDIANNLVESYFRNKTKSGDKRNSWSSTSSTYVVSHTKERENIETLKWYLSLPRETLEELLLPGWHFCPVCGNLYHENEGCLDNNNGYHVEPVEFVPYNENHDNLEWYE